MKVFSKVIWLIKLVEVEKNWYLIDVDGLVVGCFVVIIVNILCGKYKLSFILYVDCGDYVVVINVDKVWLMGNKFK